MIWTVPSGATSSIVGACMMLKRWHSSTFSSASSSSYGMPASSIWAQANLQLGQVRVATR